MAGLLDFLRGERGVLAQEQPQGLLGALSQTGAAPTYAQQLGSALTRLPSALFQPGYMQEPTSLAADLARKAFWRGSVMGMPEDVKRRDVQRGMDVALANLTAYHGSPHKFDKFDMRKVGTGEGTQVEGHGLYFSESPGLAKHYARDGTTYKVDLPDEAVGRMLDFTKPLSQQPQQVLDALKGVQWSDSKLLEKFWDRPASEFYTMLSRRDGGKQGASKTLNWLGIPGARYADSGTTNYVVFDDKVPKILQRE